MLKKIIPLIIVLLIAGYFGLQSKKKSPTQTKAANVSQPKKDATHKAKTTDTPDFLSEDSHDANLFASDIIPANRAYQSAAGAMDKILASADDYDDIVLEQFAELPDSCEWCNELYENVKEEMLATEDENLKSYLAELLAITGKEKNLETIFNAYNESDDDNSRDAYLEALEFTAGDDNLVEFLSTKLATINGDELLRESTIAAISNHGSRNAIEALYQETVKSGDSDGFYALGMGIGEIIPNDDSLPYLVELAEKKDDYSHLAIKALINQGDQGLREAINVIEGSSDSALNQKLLTDALDHVSFDEETENYIKEVQKTTQSPDVKAFADEIIADMEYEFGDDDEEDL